jgi:hypothetical protein
MPVYDDGLAMYLEGPLGIDVQMRNPMNPVNPT